MFREGIKNRRRAKIICTLGPACDREGVIPALVQNGMDVARFNFSHGTHLEHGRRMNAVRKASAEAGRPIALLLDTKGPGIRLGKLKEEPLGLQAGQEVFLVPPGEAPVSPYTLPITYPQLSASVSSGDLILLADGLIALEVLAAEEGKIRCRVQNNGFLSSGKSVNVPNVELDLPALTSQDLADLDFVLEADIDLVALSFTQCAEDVLALREALESRGADAQIIAKIETRKGVRNFGEILKVADGIMVARGDLGVEIPPEEVPLVQKKLIRACNEAGKPVITATQMLESMLTSPRPTRAEASDVANAIFDGSDGLMLSGETAVGKYPEEALKTMARIICEAERALFRKEFSFPGRETIPQTVTDAISHASSLLAADLQAAMIITPTTSGFTPRMVSKYRPLAPIIAASPDEKVLRKLCFVWGVYPLRVAPRQGTDAIINEAVQSALAQGLIGTGDLVVITAGIPAGIPGTTNLVKVHVAGKDEQL